MNYARVFALCLVLFAIQAHAQEELQYQKRINRFEGIKPKPVGGYDLELLSARVDHKEDWSRLGERLRLKFFLKDRTDVYLFVRELEYKHYYWLDKVEPATPWKVGYDNVFEWPTKDVLTRLRDFKPSELGVIARLGKPAPSQLETVAPIVFYQDKPPAKARGYVFTFRLREEANVTARIVRESDDKMLAQQKFQDQPGGRPFTVKWDLSLADAPEGHYKVVLKGYFLDSNDTFKQTVSFYHQPVIGPQ